MALHGPGGLRVRPAVVRRGRPRREPRPGARGDPRRRRPGRRARRSADPAELRGDGHPPRPRARRQGCLVRRPGPGDRGAPRARRAVPARPRPCRPFEVHRPARRVPLGRHVPVRAARCRGRAAGPGDDVDRRRGRGDLPSDAPGRGRERRGHPDRPLRLAPARPGAERRDRRDPCRARLAGPVRRAPGVRRRRHAPRGPARADRAWGRPEVARGRVRREPRARGGRGAPGRGRRQLGDARRLLRRRRPAHRPPLDPGSRRLAHLERPPLQGRDARRRRTRSTPGR